MKKILIITYYWPPSGGPGVQRWLKLCKYLVEFGIEPIVLTVDEQYASYPILDESLLENISPNLRVEKTASFEILNWYKKLNKNKEIPHGGFANQGTSISFKEKAMRFIRGNFFIPDSRKGWNSYALKRAKELIASENIDTIITTGPPHSTHLIGLKLKQKNAAIKWFADFRDPWTDIFYNELFNQTALSKSLDKSLEKKVLTNADKVIVIGENLRDLLLQKSPKLNEEHFAILPNGFDADDFSVSSQRSKNDEFIITYLGTATIEYPLENVLKAICTLPQADLAKITFQMVGKFDHEISDVLQQYAGKFRIQQMPYIQHSEVPTTLVNSDLLVLIIPKNKNNKLIVTGKIFEYLAANVPILGLGPIDGDAAKIIQLTDAGDFFAYENNTGIEQFIQAIIHENRFTFVGTEQFSRKAQAEKLAQLLLH